MATFEQHGQQDNRSYSSPLRSIGQAITERLHPVSDSPIQEACGEIQVWEGAMGSWLTEAEEVGFFIPINMRLRGKKLFEGELKKWWSQDFFK